MKDKNTIYKVKVLPYLRSLSKKEFGLAMSKFVVLAPIMTMFVMPIFSRIGLTVLNEAPDFYVALCGIIIYGLSFFKRFYLIEYLIYLGVVLFLYMSPEIYPQSEHFISENYINFVFMTIPFYFIGRTINYEKDKLILLIISRLGFVLFILYQFLAKYGYFGVADNIDDYANEQMSVAYGFLFCIMYELIFGFQHESKVDKYLSIIGILLLLFLGTRGPVVILLIFILGFFIFFYSYKSHKILKRVLFLIVLSVFYFFLTPILLGLSYLSTSFGLSSRVFDSILANEIINFSESSGRNDIYMDIIEGIKNDPTGLGYGLGGDRLFTIQSYAHNFEIEILASFGIYLGGFLLLLLLLLFIISFKNSKCSSTILFWFCMFCYGFMTLQFSGTWINSVPFFVMLGYFVSLCKKELKRV